MYFYKAYGLHIHSVIPLPELVTAAQANPDVIIKFGQVDRSLMQVYREVMYLHTTPEEVHFAWDEVGAISVRHGKEIIIDPLPNVEERLLRLPLFGMVFSVILHQRGFMALHASAVEINGGAAIFLGGKGWGKSTLAATLYGRGHNLIADDLVAVDVSNTGSPTIIPGFPLLKLLPEAAAFALGDDPETLPRIAEGFEKRARQDINRFSQRPIPLKGIYRLAEGSIPALKPLEPQQATAELISNSFIALCAHTLLTGKGGALHLHQCTSLVKSVPAYRLERPQSLELVPEMAKLVEANLAPNGYLTTV